MLERAERRILGEVTKACADLITHVDVVGFDQRETANIRQTVMKRINDLEKS